MTNPYESPSVSSSTDDAVRRRPRPRAGRTIFYGFGGALLGYVCLTILANLEGWQFYAIRSLVTGETAMSRIIEHPADCWVVRSLFFIFVLGGTLVGMWQARRRAVR
jgi:hypothetical protein